MNDDSRFESYMAQMGVKPLGDRGPVQRISFSEENEFNPDAPSSLGADDDEALFLNALETLPANAFQKDREENLEKERLRKLKRGTASHQAILDLHGMRSEEAIIALSRFVSQAFTHKRKSVMVITGKGRHSKQGRSVLKPQVEQWILKQGRHFLRAYAEAPRAYGGRGAFILYLHPPG